MKTIQSVKSAARSICIVAVSAIATLAFSSCEKERPKSAVYYGGYLLDDEDHWQPTIWKNGIPTILEKSGDGDVESIHIAKNGDVYAIGYLSGYDPYWKKSIVWKNNERITGNFGLEQVTCVFVTDDGKLFAGGIYVKDGKNYGAVSCNGTVDYSSYGEGRINTVYVTKSGDIYAGGQYAADSYPRWRMGVWVNGERLELYSSKASSSQIKTIKFLDNGESFIMGSEVYNEMPSIGQKESNSTQYWLGTQNTYLGGVYCVASAAAGRNWCILVENLKTFTQKLIKNDADVTPEYMNIDHLYIKAVGMKKDGEIYAGGRFNGNAIVYENGEMNEFGKGQISSIAIIE